MMNIEAEILRLKTELQEHYRSEQELAEMRAELLSLNIQRIQDLIKGVDDNVKTLSARKGEDHAILMERIQNAEGHIRDHCEELDDMREWRGEMRQMMKVASQRSAVFGTVVGSVVSGGIVATLTRGFL